ncbi:MAG: extracellular solute-binding protein [Hyphomicrobiales bacterium]|nr:MAG: extracellular solute-binding protein [Hyphomicrobiales bacterium]
MIATIVYENDRSIQEPEYGRIPMLKRILATAMLVAMAGTAMAQEPRTLTIISHNVHKTAATGGDLATAQNIAGEWAERNNVTLNWVTLDIGPLHDRLLREMSLGETSVDLAVVLNTRVVPSVARLLEPLDDLMAANPIEDLEGISKGLLDATAIDGKRVAIPYRHATNAMLYNKAILDERGIAVPTSLDELLAAARAATHVREDGTRVHGLIITAETHVTPLQFLSAFGATYIAPDLSVHANSPEMIAGLTELAKLHQEGVIPPNATTYSLDELIATMREGRGVFAINPFARYTALNDPAASLYPGQINAIPYPTNVAGKSAANTEFWSWAIPGNSTQKELAYDLIRELSSKEATVRAALNGNGPVRPAAYDDPRIIEKLPYAAAEAVGLRDASIAIPAFDGAVEATALFIEEMHGALLGLKTPEQAAADLQTRTEALVAKSK